MKPPKTKSKAGEMMAYIFRTYRESSLTDQELENLTTFTVGSDGKDTIQITDCELARRHLRIEHKEQGWSWQSARPLSHNQGKASSGLFDTGEILILDAQRHLAVVIIEISPDNAEIVDLSGQGTVLIGRASSCDISVGNRLVSSKHLELRRTADGWSARDLGSSNQTYRNGQRMNQADLVSGDVLDIGLCRLILTGNSLTVSCVDPIKVNILQNLTVRAAQKPGDEYPYLFKRSPRLMEDLPTGEIEFQTAPDIGAKPSINWLGVLLPSIASVLVMLGASFMLGGAMTMLYFSVPMTLVGLMMSIFNYRRQCKEYEKTEHLRLEKYDQYLSEQKAVIEDRQSNQWRILTTVHPVTSGCLAIAAEPARRLWERRPSDHDFMELRVGEGPAASCVTFHLPKQTLVLEEDALANRPQRLADGYQTVAHCPVTCPLNRFPTCGIIGERSAALTVAKNMLLQAATHHSYEDLRIVTVCGKEELSKWEFVKWLPHSFDDDRSERYIVDSPAAAKRVFTKLTEQLSQRYQNEGVSQKGSSVSVPYYLFLCADESLLEHQPIMEMLVSNDPVLGIGALFLFDEIDRLPKECTNILEAKGKKGVIYSRDNAAGQAAFTIDSMKEEGYELFARALAPLRTEAAAGKNALPASVSFLQGYRARKPQEIDGPTLWAQARPEQSMSVPIGVSANGDPFLFDIHEKHHGPHGLVAGMTGSGKSEMVQTWILSMALMFSPEAVSFVLIDFKGTGLILPFRNLPHLAGTISDLDGNITRNLIALENELTRRKTLLDEHGVSNIAAYLKLYRQGKADVPLSYLFIVIDEFAEFKAQFPDFMQAVNRVFAIGRTLGVHILLLTQKPTSVVDEKMSANTRYRWCLKVASSADSKEMLHHSDAARITNPGRAFVQVGEDEVFEQIQSYWSGAPYNPFRDLSLLRSTKVSVVDLYGFRKNYEPEKTTGYRAERNEIDAIVEFLDEYTRKNEISRAKRIWTSKLSAVIELDQLLQIAFDGERWNENAYGLCPAVGMLDDPRTQSQVPLRLNLAEEGHAVVYGAPGTGKTTFLQTLIMSLALSYPPDMVSLYLMDFGGGSLSLFGKLPHVGGVVRDAEEEKIDKLCGMLSREIERRKALFSRFGVVSIDSYREVSGDRLPYIVLILDHFAPVLNLYPGLDSFFQLLTREGGSFGVYLVATANAQNAVSYRISQNIKTGIALRMADKADYAAIVGRTDGIEPENLPGRGLFKGKPPLEFQTALPAQGQSENQRVANIRSLAALMDTKWNGRRPAPIPVMPQTVCSGEYRTDGLMVGLSVETIKPVTLNLAKEQFLLISGAANSDRIGLLRALTAQLPEVLPGAKTALYDSDGSLSVLCSGAECISDPGSFDQYIAGLMPVLQQRRERVQSGGPEDKTPPIAIVIEDLGRCFDAASNDTVKRLASIVNLGRGLKVFLIVSGRNDDIGRLYHGGDPFTMNMVGKSAALLIGGSFQSHGVFRSDGLGYTDAAAELTAMQGYLVTGPDVQKIKCVQR